MPFWRSATSPELSGSPQPSSDTSLPKIEGKRYLPQPRGPHSVGFVDVMTPGDPATGSFVRILYPTEEQCLTEHHRWPIWTEDRYLSGMLGFMKAMLERWPSWAPRDEFLGIEHMTVVGPYIPHTGFPTLFRLINGHIYVPIIHDAKPHSGKKWPLIIFSHGLGCARSTYSRICYDLASYGFIVTAVEHRDGSACMSYFLDKCSGNFQTPTWIHHRKVSHGEDEYSLRNRQVHHRAKEVSRSLDLILSLQRGEHPENLLGSISSEVLKTIGNVMDTSQPVVAGHSFGGATTVLSLLQDERFAFGIALDAWLFPLRDENLSDKIMKPILFISTDSFRSVENLTKMRELRSASEAISPHQRFLFIKGSVHQNHIDAPFVISHTFVKKVMGMHSETCPETVIDVNNKLMIQFIWKHLGVEPDDEIDHDLEKNENLVSDLF